MFAGLWACAVAGIGLNTGLRLSGKAIWPLLLGGFALAVLMAIQARHKALDNQDAAG